MDLNEIPTGSEFARHPWEVVRARFFVEKLAPAVTGEHPQLLDAGSGDAWLATRFLDGYPTLSVTCFDPGYEMSSPPELESHRISFTPSFPNGSFDVATILDVLEHVEDDRGFLEQLFGAIRPGGHLLMSVPAWPQLFSSHDVALAHFRRYRPREAAALLNATGFKLIESGGLFHSLLALRWASVKAEQWRSDTHEAQLDAKHSLEWRGGMWLRRLADSVLTADTNAGRAAARRGLQLPGLSWWALCRRPA